MSKKQQQTPAVVCPCFTVLRRNHGHWDIIDAETRIFRIRGAPGCYVVYDERPPHPKAGPSHRASTVAACMSYVVDQLMYELVVASGQEPAVIPSWNVAG